MTEEQQQWLDAHKDYSLVHVQPSIVSLYQWCDQGFLYPNGQFFLDDGTTLIYYPYECGAVRVGRMCEIV